MQKAIEKVTQANFEAWLAMGLKLWPENHDEEARALFTTLLRKSNEEAFIYKHNNQYIGFINMSLRYDYVEGTDSSPVGYVEGIYVEEAFRGRGIAHELLKAGEVWARDRGCTQLASDCELHNDPSLKFHKAVGFTEVNRLVCFVRDIE